MKFLIDAQLPPALARWLTARGHHATHVVDMGLVAAADTLIATRVEQGGAVLVSKDEDFVLLRLPDRFTLLWLRVGNVTNRALLAWLEPRWSVVERMLEAGERFIEVR